jgi:ADP-ribose pyrophosphatase YjhB (NUDIX family)
LPDTRPGFGCRHPDLVALLAALAPAAVDRISWPGELVLAVAAYPVPAPVPQELVTSVRCVVRVGERVVVCETPNDRHLWPGGRRLPGETYEETARREVHEETGWLIDQPRPLGFLHFRHVDPCPDGYAYPYPDFLQVVFTAPARRRAGGADWVDLDGWELGHRLCTVSELTWINGVERVFLAAATAGRASGREPPARGAPCPDPPGSR